MSTYITNKMSFKDSIVALVNGSGSKETKAYEGRFLDITSWNPSVCMSNRLHVDAIWFSFIKLRYIL